MGQPLVSEQVLRSSTGPPPQGDPRHIPSCVWQISMTAGGCNQFGNPVVKNEVNSLLGWFARRWTQLLRTKGVVTAVAAGGTQVTSSALPMCDVHLDIHCSYDEVAGAVIAASTSGRLKSVGGG